MRRSRRGVRQRMIDTAVAITAQACAARSRPDLAERLLARPLASEATATKLRAATRELCHLAARWSGSAPAAAQQPDLAKAIRSCIDILTNVAATWTWWPTRRLTRILEWELADCARYAVAAGVLDVQVTFLAEGAGYATAISLTDLLQPAGRRPRDTHRHNGAPHPAAREALASGVTAHPQTNPGTEE